MSLYFFCSLQGIYIVPGPLKNAETRPRWSTNGSDGSDARGVRRRLYRSCDRRFRYAANRNGKCRDVKVCNMWRTCENYIYGQSRKIVYAVTWGPSVTQVKFLHRNVESVWYISINSTRTQRVRSILTVSRFRCFLAKFHLFKFAKLNTSRVEFCLGEYKL